MGKIKITTDDCRSCGACCITGDQDVIDRYADMTTEDVARVSPHVRQQLHKISVGGEQWYATPGKQLEDDRYSCRYLRGTPGARCSCGIYETRPAVCRDFKVGGLTCQRARKAAEIAEIRR